MHACVYNGVAFNMALLLQKGLRNFLLSFGLATMVPTGLESTLSNLLDLTCPIVLVLFFWKPLTFYVHFLANSVVINLYKMSPECHCGQFMSAWSCHPTDISRYSCQWMFATDSKNIPVNLVLHFSTSLKEQNPDFLYWSIKDDNR